MAIVKELKRERDRLDKAIAVLEETDLFPTPRTLPPSVTPPGPPAKKVDRLTPEGRKRLSEALKKRWAERKKAARAGK
jgi:hypothetical protein